VHYKSKTKEIKYKVLNEENKIWRKIPGHRSVRRKGRDTIGNNY